MTTITIERELLVRIEKELFLARNYGGTLRDEPLLKKVSAVLALASEFDSIIEAIGDDPAPATAPEQPAWQDAPNVPGLWMRIGRTSGDAALIRHLESDDIWYEGYRWFGPITPDSGDKK